MPSPQTSPTPIQLNYALAPKASKRPWLIAFTFLTIAIAVPYWRSGDWYAYVKRHDGTWMPKFEMPLWYQIGVSLAVGAFLAGATLALLYPLLRWVRNKF